MLDAAAGYTSVCSSHPAQKDPWALPSWGVSAHLCEPQPHHPVSAEKWQLADSEREEANLYRQGLWFQKRCQGMSGGTHSPRVNLGKSEYFIPPRCQRLHPWFKKKRQGERGAGNNIIFKQEWVCKRRRLGWADRVWSYQETPKPIHILCYLRWAWQVVCEVEQLGAQQSFYRASASVSSTLHSPERLGSIFSSLVWPYEKHKYLQVIATNQLKIGPLDVP